MPASTRQGRVACEFVAVVVLSGIPRDDLARLPPKEAPIASALSKHPHWSVFELYEPRPVDADNPGDMEPALQATQFFKSFLYAAHEVVGYSKQNLESLSKYRRFVQHPSSHGTADLVSQHFSGFTEDSPRGGIFFSKDRLPRLIHEAYQLIALAALCADILDWTSNVYLSRGRDA